MVGEKKCNQPGGKLVLRKKIYSLSHHIAGQMGVKMMMDGKVSCAYCLVMHTSSSLVKSRLHVTTLKIDLSSQQNSVPISTVATFTKAHFSAFH